MKIFSTEEVLLLPAVHEFFNRCVNSIAAASDMLNKTDLHDKTKVTSLWVLSELSANLKGNVAVCSAVSSLVLT